MNLEQTQSKKTTLNAEHRANSGSPHCSPVDVQDMPTEPGLYWASCCIKGRYDSLLHVFGEQPFLKIKIINVPVFVEAGTPMYAGNYGRLWDVGPKVVIPVLDDR